MQRIDNDVGGTGAGAESGDADDLRYVDPASIRDVTGPGPDSTEPVKRKRGRPPGTGRAQKSDTASLTGVDIGDILKSIHALLAVKFGEYWAIDDGEAKQLDKSIKRAMRHQDMQVTQKQLDYVFAAYVIAQVYGTRIATSFITASKKSRPENVVKFQFPA